jgi:predicted Zn-dependent protease
MQRAYSQQDDLEADRFAVGLLDAAGYCAGALSDLFAVWAAEAEPTDVYFQLFAATHPALEYRIAEMAPEIERREACEAVAAGAPDPLEAVQARLGGGE